MNMVIKCLLAALWLLAVPWAAGGTVFYKSKKKSMGMYLLAGYLLMFSVAELMILPMMWAKLSLHILEYSFAGVMAVAAVAGFFSWRLHHFWHIWMPTMLFMWQLPQRLYIQIRFFP